MRSRKKVPSSRVSGRGVNICHRGASEEVRGAQAAWRGSQEGGRALWAVPASFVGTMALGFALALGGVSLPFVEPAILASIVALGLLVAMAVRMETAACAAVVGIFALFHGYAHGSELGAAGALPFGAGFVVATALLHIAGIGLGLGIGKLSAGGVLSRILGGITALAGLALIFN